MSIFNLGVPNKEAILELLFAHCKMSTTHYVLKINFLWQKKNPLQNLIMLAGSLIKLIRVLVLHQKKYSEKFFLENSLLYSVINF